MTSQQRDLALDAALLLALAGSGLTSWTVLFFHVAFLVLGLAAFFRDFRGFALRAVPGGLVAAAIVATAVVQGTTQAEELIEIPLLGAMTAIIFAIAAQRRLTEERLAHLAHHDPLTGLGTRAVLRDGLRDAGERLRRRDEPFALLFLDVDDFKTINDVGGHALGDAVLVEIARRLEAAVRGSDLVARMGGDEFAIVLNDLDSVSRAEQLAARIVRAVAEPLHVGDRVIGVTVSVGLAGGSDVGPREMLLRADTAMYAAKGGGRSQVRLAEPLLSSTR